MITIWPIDKPGAALRGKESCDLMFRHYDLYAGQAAIADATAQGKTLSGRGPFLIGWSPPDSRYVKHAIVLVVDMSEFETQASFDEALMFWQDKVVEDPTLWESGFSIKKIRLALRDFSDHYGSDILKAVNYSTE
jgi:hypothetical protein